MWRVFWGVSDPLGASAGPWKGVRGVFWGCRGGLVRSTVVAMRVAGSSGRERALIKGIGNNDARLILRRNLNGATT